MSMVIRGWPAGQAPTEPRFKQLAHSLKRGFVHRSIQALFSSKAATFNGRIKSPKSQHWHLAKATGEEREESRNTGRVPEHSAVDRGGEGKRRKVRE